MNKVKLGVAVLMMISMSAAGCRRGSNAPAPQEEKFAVVKAAGGLNMRSAPTVSAEKIITIPAGSRVKIVSLSDKKERVGKTMDFWAQIDFEGKKGWVFNGFLGYDPAPSSGGDAGFQIEVLSREMMEYVDTRVKGRSPQIQLSPTEFWLMVQGGGDGKSHFSCSVICDGGCEGAPVCDINRMIVENNKITLYITENKSKKMKCTVGREAFAESSTAGGTCEDL